MRSRRGWVWLAGSVTVFVTAYDLHAVRHGNPTLTAQLKNAIKHPIKRWPILCAWTLLTVHLFGPDMYDPFWPLGRGLHRLARLGRPALHLQPRMI